MKSWCGIKTMNSTSGSAGRAVACCSLPVFYGWNGSVPVALVQSSVWIGLVLVVGVTSVATLVQYRLGRLPDAARA